MCVTVYAYIMYVDVCVYICICVRTRVCFMCVCMYVYVCMYVCMYASPVYGLGKLGKCL